MYHCNSDDRESRREAFLRLAASVQCAFPLSLGTNNSGWDRDIITAATISRLAVCRALSLVIRLNYLTPLIFATLIGGNGGHYPHPMGQQTEAQRITCQTQRHIARMWRIEDLILGLLNITASPLPSTTFHLKGQLRACKGPHNCISGFKISAFTFQIVRLSVCPGLL